MQCEPSPSPPPDSSDALSRTGLRRVLVTLCITEIVSWGILFYAFPVLVTDISAETGWARTPVTAAFSAGLLVAALAGIPVGRWLDRHGPRGIMTMGSALAAPAVALIAIAPNMVVFTLAWLVAGVAMAAILYPPAFTALTRWYGPRRVRALTVLTLAAGLASTVFAPLTAALREYLGWRATYLVLAAILAAVTVPAHWWGLRGPWPRRDTAESGEPPQRSSTPAMTLQFQPDEPGQVARSKPFLALLVAMGLSSFAAHAVVINLVPLLIERGLDTSTAAIALGLGGAGQVAGRIAYPTLSRRVGVRARTAIILLGTALTIGLLSLLVEPAALIAAAIVAGIARGLLTLVQATAITDRWGVAHYGRLTGLLSAPVTITIALGPWAGAAMADALGSYANAFLGIAALGLLSVAAGLFSVPRRP